MIFKPQTKRSCINQNDTVLNQCLGSYKFVIGCIVNNINDTRFTRNPYKENVWDKTIIGKCFKTHFLKPKQSFHDLNGEHDASCFLHEYERDVYAWHRAIIKKIVLNNSNYISQNTFVFAAGRPNSNFLFLRRATRFPPVFRRL